MYTPALYTNLDGTIDEVRKAEVLKSSKNYSNQIKRRKRRIKLVTERFNPEEYFKTEVYTKQMKDVVPTILYEPGSGLYNMIDYLINAVEYFTGKKHSYSEHKKTVTEFVKYFNIKPSDKDVSESQRKTSPSSGKYRNKLRCV